MIGSAGKLLAYPDRLADFVAGRPVTPVTVEVHPSGKCNQACAYCNAPKSGLIMSDADAVKLASELKANGIAGIVISGGGEPTLGPWRTFVGGIPAGLITNGSIPVEDYSGLRWVRFSVDARAPAAYEAIRGTPWPNCLEANIRRAISQTRVGIQAVVRKENLDSLVYLTAWSKKIGANYVQIRPDEYTENPPWLRPSLEARIRANARRRFGVFLRCDKLNPQGPGRCHAGNFRMTVSPDLKCYACACAGYRKCFGSLADDDLRTILEGEKRMAELRAKNREFCPPGCVGSGINAAIDGGMDHEFL